MLPQVVCPLVIKSLRSQADFPLTVRLMRTVVLLVSEYRPFIVGEVEALLTLLLKMLHDAHHCNASAPMWHRALTLEALLMLCTARHTALDNGASSRATAEEDAGTGVGDTDGGPGTGHSSQSPFLLQIFRAYDENRRSSNLFARFVESVSAFVTDTIMEVGHNQESVPREHVGHADTRQGVSAAELLDRHARERRAQGVRGARVLGSTWSASGIGERPTRGLDLLGETEPPEKISLASVMLAGVEILVSIVDALSPRGEPQGPEIVHQGTTDPPHNEQSTRLRRNMIDACWTHLLCSLTAVLVRCSDETVVQVLLNATQTMTNSCGELGLEKARNSFLNLICHIALLPNVPPHTMRGDQRDISGTGAGPIEKLSPKNIQGFKTLFNVAHYLGDNLGNGWYIALAAFHQLDRVLGCHQHDSGTTYAPASEASIVISALQSVFESSRHLCHRPSCYFLSILGNVTLTARRTNIPLVSALIGKQTHLHRELRRCNDENRKHRGVGFESLVSFVAGDTEHIYDIDNTPSVRKSRSPFGSDVVLTATRENQGSLAALHSKHGSHRDDSTGRHGRARGSAGEARAPNGSALAASNATTPRRRRVPPFFLEKLVEATLHNVFRLEKLWGAAFVHFHFACSCGNDFYAIKALVDLAVARFDKAAEGGPGCIRVAQRRSLQCELLSLFVDFAQFPVPIASTALASLFTLLQAAGHTLSTGWPLVILAVHDVANNFVPSAAGDVLLENGECWGSCTCSAEASLTRPPCQRGFDLPSRWESSFSSAKPSSSAASLVPLAFKSLELIVDEFLMTLCGSRTHVVSIGKGMRRSARPAAAEAPLCLVHLIDCLRAFGSQCSDVNISLTAVNMVWTLSDHVHREWRASRPGQNPSVFTTATTNRLWLDIFSQLCMMGCDSRPEVRNCAIRTLCSIIVAHGGSMTYEALALCLMEPLPRGVSSLPRSLVPSLFLLLENIEVAAADAEANAVGEAESEHARARPGGGPVVVHHSRNTVPKQWNETRVLAIQGITRVMRSFFERLRDQQWFRRAWGRMLEMLRDAILHGVCGGGNATRSGREKTSRGGHVTGSSLEVSVAAVHALGDMVTASFSATHMTSTSTGVGGRRGIGVEWGNASTSAANAEPDRGIMSGRDRIHVDALRACESAWSALTDAAKGAATSAGDRVSGDNEDGDLAVAIVNAVRQVYSSGHQPHGSSGGDADTKTPTAGAGRQHCCLHRQLHRQPAHMRRALALLHTIGCMRGYARSRHGIVSLERAVVATIEQVPPFPVSMWRDVFSVLRGFMTNDLGSFSPALANKACAALMKLHVVETGMAAQRMLERRLRSDAAHQRN